MQPTESHSGAEVAAGGRNVTVKRDAVGTLIVTGDNNRDISLTVYVGGNLTTRNDKVNPYVGLASFTEADANNFFGRAELVSLARDRLSAVVTSDEPRLLCFYGPSGVGKSSLLRAGLLPELVRRPIPEWKKVDTCILRPGKRPMRSLLAALTPVLGLQHPTQKNLERALVKLARKRALVICIDQAEEAFLPLSRTLRDETRNFLDVLTRACRTANGRVAVVLTLRVDMLEATHAHPDFHACVQSGLFDVPPLTEQAMRAAIEEPARRAGQSFPETFVDTLLEQARHHRGAVPLVEFTLTTLWNHAGDHAYLSKELERLGGIGGVLAVTADGLHATLQPEEQAIAERAFSRLVRYDEGFGYVRLRLRIGELCGSSSEAAVQAVLEKFASESTRLLTIYKDKEVELTHEALILRWAKLTHWVLDRQETNRVLSRLRDARRAWLQSGRSLGNLLRPPLLDQLVECERARKQEFTSEERLFLRKSRRVRLVYASALGLLATAFLGAAVVIYMLYRKANDANEALHKALDETVASKTEAEQSERSARASGQTVAAALIQDDLSQLSTLAAIDWAFAPDRATELAEGMSAKWLPVAALPIAANDIVVRNKSFAVSSPETPWQEFTFGRPLTQMRETAPWRQSVLLARDGSGDRFVIPSDADPGVSVKVVDTKTNAEYLVAPDARADSQPNWHLSADGSRLSVLVAGGTLETWELPSTGPPRRHHSAHISYGEWLEVGGLEFSSDGHYILTHSIEHGPPEIGQPTSIHSVDSASAYDFPKGIDWWAFSSTGHAVVVSAIRKMDQTEGFPLETTLECMDLIGETIRKVKLPEEIRDPQCAVAVDDCSHIVVANGLGTWNLVTRPIAKIEPMTDEDGATCAATARCSASMNANHGVVFYDGKVLRDWKLGALRALHTSHVATSIIPSLSWEDPGFVKILPNGTGVLLANGADVRLWAFEDAPEASGGSAVQRLRELDNSICSCMKAEDRAALLGESVQDATTHAAECMTSKRDCVPRGIAP